MEELFAGTEMFIAFQGYDDMNDPFVIAALEESMNKLPMDIFLMPDVRPLYDLMRAYLML